MPEAESEYPCDRNGESLAAGGDYVAHILAIMNQTHVCIRSLALHAGIGKSRIGLLLHRDPSKRSAMHLNELRAILTALDVELLETVFCVETLHDENIRYSDRYRTLISMLCALFRHLPASLIAALDDVVDLDGTEVRPEWAVPLQRAMIKRIVHEINAVTSRRAMLSDFSIFS